MRTAAGCDHAASACRSIRLCRRGGYGGDREVEHRPGSFSALHPDLPTVNLDDLACDGEPESSADDLARTLFVALKAPEQAVHEVGRDSDTGIRDADVHRAVRKMRRDQDFSAFRRVLYRI